MDQAELAYRRRVKALLLEATRSGSRAVGGVIAKVAKEHHYNSGGVIFKIIEAVEPPYLLAVENAGRAYAATVNWQPGRRQRMKEYARRRLKEALREIPRLYTPRPLFPLQPSAITSRQKQYADLERRLQDLLEGYFAGAIVPGQLKPWWQHQPWVAVISISMLGAAAVGSVIASRILD